VRPRLEAAERHRLADLFLELGPEAPTLCEGWTARDLAAHLVVIEHPEAWAGGGSWRRVAVANRLHDRVMERERRKPWRQQVERVRRGPVGGPLAWAPVRERMYIREYLIHHEDLRRANGLGPRTDIPELQEVAWRKVTSVGKLGLKRAMRTAPDCGLELERSTNGARFVLRAAERMIHLAGEPLELLLFAFGRRSAAVVDISGDPQGVAALRHGTWTV
jgi:uncharacterized protein (TIGR03085 family)